jgi:hypothetical protein
MTQQPMPASEVSRIVDRHQAIRSAREGRAADFLADRRRHLIFQTPGGDVWGDARAPEHCFERNMRYIADSLDVPSDRALDRIMPVDVPSHRLVR